MKTMMITAVTLLVVSLTALSNPDEQEKVKEVITMSYVEGIHNLGSLDEVAKGFHPDFEMLINRDGVLTKYPISAWIESMKKSRAANTNQTAEGTDVNFISIDVTGNAATAKFELIKGGKVIFTDYMFLYKFGEDWKIVSKIFYRH